MTTIEAGFAPKIETWTDLIAPTREVPVDQTGDTTQTGISTVAHQQMTSQPVALPEIQPLRGVAASGFLLPNQKEAAVVVIQLGTRPGEHARVRTQGEPDRRPAPASRALPALPPVPGNPFVKHLQHLDYLKRVSTEGNPPPITQETATLARKAWQAIWIASRFSMPVPAACTGPDGELFYSWDRGRHHLELEIIPGQPAEFFYRDRETEQFWGEDYNVGDRLPAEMVEKLKLLI
jgi:hypothetical protein